MGYHPRIESSDVASFTTSRCRRSELWFVNNERLERACLGYIAKFAARYEVSLYALAIEGNHIHTVSHFPRENRSDFLRDTNSCIARAVTRYTAYQGGSLFARRYSAEILPDSPDIEARFFYTVLQPVKDGLVERLSDYPGYNCFADAVRGIKRPFTVVNWAAYNSAKRHNPHVNITHFTETVLLSFARLPGYHHLSQKEYATLMHDKLEHYRLAIVQERQRNNQTFLGRKALKLIKPGTLPKNSKSSTSPTQHRPRVLCVCPARKKQTLKWYWHIYHQYKIASKLYRNGNLNTPFPKGTYRPHLHHSCITTMPPPSTTVPA